MPEKNVHEWESCGRKRSFFCASDAAKVGRKYNQEMYKCKYCHCWHLTKKLMSDKELRDMYGDNI